jgi:flagellin
LGLGTAASGNNVFIGGRLGFTDTASDISASFATSASMSLVINGTVITVISSDTSGAGGSVLDINDVVTAVNNSRAGVKASAFNEVTAAYAGSGVIGTNDQFVVTVTSLDDGEDYAFTVSNTESLQEVADKLNAQGGANTVQARINDEGKLVLFNNSGATITTTTNVGTTYGEKAATGFEDGIIFQGMLKLESETDNPISIGTTAKQLGKSDGEANAALATLGLVQIYGVRSGDTSTAPGASTEVFTDAYTYEGAAGAANAGITSTLEWAAGEIKLNGVDIYRSGQITDTLAKKVQLINTFADQTGVFAAAVSNDQGAMIIQLNSVNNRPISIDLGNDTLGDYGGLASHGLREINVGDAYYDATTPGYGAGGGSSLTGMNVLSAASATSALSAIDNAIEQVSQSRAQLGAYQNRLIATVNNLTNIATNTEAAKSRIMDTDYSKETTKLAKSQIIQQAATAMLAQANQAPQMVLALLK